MGWREGNREKRNNNNNNKKEEGGREGGKFFGDDGEDAEGGRKGGEEEELEREGEEEKEGMPAPAMQVDIEEGLGKRARRKSRRDKAGGYLILHQGAPPGWE